MFIKYSSLEYGEYGSLEHMKLKVNIFDGEKKNAISTSGFPNN